MLGFVPLIPLILTAGVLAKVTDTPPKNRSELIWWYRAKAHNEDVAGGRARSFRLYTTAAAHARRAAAYRAAAYRLTPSPAYAPVVRGGQIPFNPMIVFAPPSPYAPTTTVMTATPAVIPASLAVTPAAPTSIDVTPAAPTSIEATVPAPVVPAALTPAMVETATTPLPMPTPWYKRPLFLGVGVIVLGGAYYVSQKRRAA